MQQVAQRMHDAALTDYTQATITQETYQENGRDKGDIPLEPASVDDDAMQVESGGHVTEQPLIDEPQW